METVINSFDFSDKEEVRSFFAYILSNIAVKKIFIRIFPARDLDYYFRSGIKPIKVSEEQKRIGPDALAENISLCDYETETDSFTVRISEIRKIEILQP